MPLDDNADLLMLKPLALDAQATGSTPPAARLLELAWARLDPTRVEPEAPLDAWLLAGLDAIPPRISALTGVTPALYAASPRLDAAALRQRLGDALADAPLVVVHYARFERPFLEALLGASPLPFELLCTWELARRAIPDLPRRGIRPLAGFLGHPVGDLKRSADYVRATAAIWHHLLRRLRDERQLTTLGELRALLEGRAPAPDPQRRLVPLERQVRLDLPAQPGVYHLCDAHGRVLYVGKATSLKERVNAYFRSRKRAAHKDLELVAQVWSVTPHVVSTPLEAALMEVDHLRDLRPPYNVALLPDERPLTFASPDLRSLQPTPDRRHPFGPLTSTRPPRVLTQLLDQARSPDPEALLAALDLPAPWAPDLDTLALGLQHFLDHHGHPRRLSDLLSIGLRLHLERRAAAAAPEDAPEDAAEAPATSEPFAWTPERLAALLDDQLLDAARRLRQARWLALLSDAAVTWLPRNHRARLRHLLLQSGEVVAVGEAPLSAPLGRGGHLTRLAGLTPHAVLRLTVLTGELRALLRRERHLTVHLPTGRSLDAAALRAALYRF